MKSLRFYILSCAVAALVCFAPGASHAGISDVLSRAFSWWGERAAGQSSSSFERGESGSGEEGQGGGDEESKPASGAAAGMCAVPREPPRTECEPGSGFLCVDTPPGGIAGEGFTLRGTVDRKGSVVASINISVQNEYTKRTVLVDTSAPAGSGCLGELSEGTPFCLDSAGYFAAWVPLDEKGPATISVSASRLSGEPVRKTVRTSRVVPLSLDGKSVKLDPDVRSGEKADGTHVTATISLLGDCQFCDFIGASTGGVSVTVENLMTDGAGSVRVISCPTTVEQGGQGRFVVGVPVGPGKNSLRITACNAAHAEGSCPSISGMEFDAEGEPNALKIISPPPMPAYDLDEYPAIDWEFSLGSSEECVHIQFNREPPREVCADGNGRYKTRLSPRVGTNAATISRGGLEEFAWTFGWGKVTSPHVNGGRILLPEAARFALPSSTVRHILVPLLNNFLKSDELPAFLEDAMGGAVSAGEDEKAPPVSIPMCGFGGGLGGSRIALRGKPAVGDAKIEEVSFADGRIDMKAVFRDLRVGIDLIPDEDGDGLPDRDPLPLVVAFRKAIAFVSMETKIGEDGEVLILVSSPDDDCSY
ncbi:MAG TPA: hypothetical protein PLZ86_08590, partial [bacterium]|nr:hypothetical protein [bacterium]